MFHSPETSVHLIADIEASSGLGDIALIEATLRDAACAAGATVLDIRLHHFGPGMGVTGVALLAESHISIHTWPENNLAAVDLFVCGKSADPGAGLERIRERLGGTIRSEHRIRRLDFAPAAVCKGLG